MLRKKLEALCKDSNVKTQHEKNEINECKTISTVNSEQLNAISKNFELIDASWPNVSLKQVYVEMGASKTFVTSKLVALILSHFEPIFTDIYALFTDKEGFTINATITHPVIELEVGSIYILKDACLIKSGVRNCHLLITTQNIVHIHLFR